MSLTKQDEGTLRALAARCVDIANRPEQRETRELWLALNRCKPERPMVLIDQIPWSELDVDGSLVCTIEDPYWRNVECELRRTLYRWAHMPVDMVVNPYIALPRPLIRTGYGIEPVREERTINATNETHAMRFERVIRSLDDVEKIQAPTSVLDASAQARIVDQAQRTFAGVAPIAWTGETMHLGIWDYVTQLFGVEEIYLGLMDEPELYHALMDRLTSATITHIEQLDQAGLFDARTNLCHCSHTFSDDLPRPECDPDAPHAKDVWAFGLAQLFTSVSPAVTAEFEVPYMQRIFPYFGAIYYGCCDRLDDRLDIITRMPNIRKISCSPWSDRARFAEHLPDGYVMSNKPNPSYLAADGQREACRHDLRRTVQVARANGRPLEMILKDISTVGGQPRRLWQWAKDALEIAQG